MQDHPEVLLDYLRERGLEHARPVSVFATPEERPWIERLLQAIGSAHPAHWEPVAFPSQRIALVATVSGTSAHFRAVAKIAFHYTLKMFPDLTGREPEFSGIKSYIWDEGDTDRFVRQLNRQFVMNLQQGFRPAYWTHILAVERSDLGISAYAQFFVGPHSLPPPYQILIGSDPARIISRRETRAHQFVIQDPTASPYIGVMEDLRPANYILPVPFALR